VTDATPRGDDVLSDVDRELLNAVQWDFPLEPRPYAVLGQRLGLDEPAVRERVAHVKDVGVLRQLSAIFDTRALGYGSSLVACKAQSRSGGAFRARPARWARALFGGGDAGKRHGDLPAGTGRHPASIEGTAGSVDSTVYFG
jgi:DNA-binding Lrp family transcriptional regulator